MDKLLEKIIKSITSIDEYGYKDKIGMENLNDLYSIREKIEKGNYSSVDEIIRKYKVIATKIWQEYLKTSDSKDSFRYLIHNIGYREYYDDYSDDVISTSLISDKQMAFYAQFAKGTPNGFIVYPKSIRTATIFDNDIENNNSQTTGMYDLLQLPYELEHDFISEAKQRNSYLNYKSENGQEYYGNGDCNEISCDKFDITGYFFVSFGEGKLNPVYAKAKRMAEARGIPLKEIDFMHVREQNGLNPMNNDMKRALFKNLMIRWGNQLREKDKMTYYPIVDEEFIESNYENFAQKYVQLKQSPDFNTENILKQFRQTLLDNEYRISTENPEYKIGDGLYIDGMTEDDWNYIETLRYRGRADNNRIKDLTWKEVVEGTKEQFKSHPNDTLSRIRALREQLLSNEYDR